MCGSSIFTFPSRLGRLSHALAAVIVAVAINRCGSERRQR